MATKTAPNPMLEKMKQGLALQQAGEYEKAQRIYKAVLKKAPNSPDANHLLGVTYRQLGFPLRALDLIRKAIKLAPDRGPYYANLARTLSDIPDTPPEEIITAAEKAIELNDGLVEAHNLRAIALTKLEREDEAEDIFRQLIGAYPKHPDAYRNYGILLRDRGNHAGALDFFVTAARMEPDNVEVMVQRSRARFELAEYDTSQAELEDALARFPAHGDLNHEMARLLFKCGDAYKALPYAKIAIAEKPQDVHRLVTLGVIYQSLGQSKEAVQALQKARDNWSEDMPVAQWNMSLAYLGMGDLETGWDLYSARFRSNLTSVLTRTFDKPEWDGSDISDKTVLVWTDQGVGDAFRSGTMLPELIDRAGHVIVEVAHKLIPPFARSFPEATIRLSEFEQLTMRATRNDYDVHICLSELARFFRRDFASFKRVKHPVFKVNRERARELYARIPEAGEKPVVGVSWRSRNLSPARAKNYLAVMELAPIVETPDIVFVNLQYACIDREITYLTEGRGANLIHLADVDQFNNLEDAAALASCCDLVISANTSVAEIAGSYDIPCWTFGDRAGHFQLGQEVPPWYRSMTYTVTPPGEPVVTLVPELVARLEQWKDTFVPDARLARLGL